MLALPSAPGDVADDADEFAASRADWAQDRLGAPGDRWNRRGHRAAPDRARPPGRGQDRDHPPPPLSMAGVKRWAVRAALPMVSMVAIGVALVAAFGGVNGAGPSPGQLSVGFPPATQASNDFSTIAAEQGRGINQVLTAAASSGNQVVAVGSQTGARIGRAQFFVSNDGGQTWSLGAEQASDGGQPAPDHPATMIAGGAGRWVAVGPASVWTSASGTSWTLRSAQGITPVQTGDQVTLLRRTATGFLAAGHTASGEPVAWTSANGTSWRRLGPAQLKLAAPGGGTVGAITSAAAAANTTLIAAGVTQRTAQGTTERTAVWRSADDGTTWSPVTVPGGHGTTSSVAGLAVAGSTFVAVRPGQVQGRADAVAFTSPDGQTWKFGASITGPNGAALNVADVGGGSGGAVIAAASDGATLAFTSANGVSWQVAGNLASAAAGTVADVATTADGAVVTAGHSATQQGQQPLLTVDRAGQIRPVSLAGIPGAVEPELAVNGITASGSLQVAVGSANGLPATWFSADAGTTWSRGAGATANVLNRPGLQQLTGVADGAQGWVAVGGVQSGATQHPVVVTSAAGRSWQTADSAGPFTGTGLFTSAVAAGPAGYVIVGRQVSGGRTVAAAWWSAGLTGWQRATDAAPGALDMAGAGRQMLAVTAGASGFTAVGSAGSHPAAWTSGNGRTWRAVTLSLPSSSVKAQLSQITVNGRVLVAVGTATMAAGRTVPFAAMSKDGGSTWTETLLPSPGGAAAVDAVAATGAGFTAVGTFGVAGGQNVVIWTSTDGAGWTSNAPSVTGLGGQGIQEITGLTVSGSTLTGVGFTASAASETPTIWRSPIRN
jgi:hypothetical protein